MFELSVSADFAASHFLRGYEGKCKNLHGHTWKVELTLAGKRLDKIGLLADFMVVKKQLKEVLDTIDHVHLNDMAIFKENNPTTENLAKYIFEEFSKKYPSLKVRKITVWESDNASIAYQP